MSPFGTTSTSRMPPPSRDTQRVRRRSATLLGLVLLGAGAAVALPLAEAWSQSQNGPASVAPVAEKLVDAVVNI